MRKSYKFSREFGRRGLTRRGASDWYSDEEKELREAVASGLPFDTNWGACKHECLSTRIECDGEQGYTCSASVTDDLEQGGVGTVDIACDNPNIESLLQVIRDSLDDAWELAQVDQKQNQCYRGFHICRRRTKRSSWDRVETYIQRWKGSDWLTAPPGDFYHRWGFQGECNDIPEATKEKLEAWIRSYRPGKDVPSLFEDGNWAAEIWED